jgi:galactokinase
MPALTWRWVDDSDLVGSCRVNLVGEHTDYNDGLVLPFALPMTTTASVTANDSGKVTVTSDGADDPVTFDVDASPDDVSGWARTSQAWCGGSTGCWAMAPLRATARPPASPD